MRLDSGGEWRSPSEVWLSVSPLLGLLFRPFTHPAGDKLVNSRLSPRLGQN